MTRRHRRRADERTILVDQIPPAAVDQQVVPRSAGRGRVDFLERFVEREPLGIALPPEHALEIAAGDDELIDHLPLAWCQAAASNGIWTGLNRASRCSRSGTVAPSAASTSTVGRSAMGAGDAGGVAAGAPCSARSAAGHQRTAAIAVSRQAYFIGEIYSAPGTSGTSGTTNSRGALGLREGGCRRV